MQNLTSQFFLLANLIPSASVQIEGRTLTHRQRVRMVAVLARQFMKVSGYNLSTALKLSWKIVKQHERDIQLVEFITVKGAVKQRVVFLQPWSAFYEVKGTGRPTPEGLKLFVGVAKYAAGKQATCSCYKNRILEIL